MVTAGQTYAIVLPPGPFTGATDPSYKWTIAFADVYATGVAWDYNSGSAVWQSYVFGSDRTFRTYVDNAPDDDGQVDDVDDGNANNEDQGQDGNVDDDAPVLDQSQTVSDYGSFYQPHNLGTAGATGVAQTFTAGLSGRLSLELELRRFVEAGTTEALAVELHAGDPTGPLLASAGVPAASIPETFAWIPVSFGSPAMVTAGQTYAIVLPPGPFTGATDPAYLWTTAFADVYANGVAWDHYVDSGVWQSYFFGSDRTFRTYVDNATPGDQGAS